MTHIINYTAWFNIFALAFQLVNDPLIQEGVVVKPRWGIIDEVDLVWVLFFEYFHVSDRFEYYVKLHGNM